MMRVISILTLLLSTSITFGQSVYIATSKQEAVDSSLILNQSHKYVDSRLSDLDSYAKRSRKQSLRVLNHLSKKEDKYLKQLKKKDSISYSNLKQQVGFDSIKSIASNTKTAKFTQKTKSTLQTTIDSLRGIAKFMQGSNVASVKGNENVSNQFGDLETKLNTNQYIDQLIQTRTSSLMNCAKGNHVGGSLKGISKQTYYYKQKAEEYKKITQDPSILEEKALNYLKGIKGFEENLSSGSSENSNGMHNAKNADELEKMGYQTKRQVNKQLSSQLGLGNDSKKMDEINSQVKNEIGKFKEIKQEVNKVKTTVGRIGSIKKPSFKVNPMRGLPLKLRLEKSANWQVLKSSEGKPAVLELNTQLGFKHTPSLTYSLVAGGSLGLGRDWNHIKLSFQGFRIGANTDIKFIWGISGQIGYERVYKQYSTTKLQLAGDGIPQQLITETKMYRDVAYTGIQKTYKLNSKYTGTILLAYDWLWKQGNARTPIIWRMGWKK